MKNRLLLISVLFLVLISCRKDDNVDIQNEIVGTWKMTKDIIISGKDNSIISTDPVLDSDCESKNRYTFDSSNRYSYSDHKKTSSICKLFKTANGDYSYDNSTKKLTIKFDGSNESVTSNLHSLKTNEMQLIQEDYNDYNNDGINDKFITVFNK